MDTNSPIRKNWFRKHIILILAALLVAGVGVAWAVRGQQYASTKPAVTPQTKQQAAASPKPSGGTVAGSSVSSSSSSKTEVSSSTGSTPVPAAGGTTTKMTLFGSQATVKPGEGATVTGQITNNQNSPKSANIQATFYAKSGGVMGTAKGSATNIGADQTKTFTLTTTQNVEGYEKMVVETSSIY